MKSSTSSMTIRHHNTIAHTRKHIHIHIHIPPRTPSAPHSLVKSPAAGPRDAVRAAAPDTGASLLAAASCRARWGWPRTLHAARCGARCCGCVRVRVVGWRVTCMHAPVCLPSHHRLPGRPGGRSYVSSSSGLAGTAAASTLAAAAASTPAAAAASAALARGSHHHQQQRLPAPPTALTTTAAAAAARRPRGRTTTPPQGAAAAPAKPRRAARGAQGPAVGRPPGRRGAAEPGGHGHACVHGLQGHAVAGPRAAAGLRGAAGAGRQLPPAHVHAVRRGAAPCVAVSRSPLSHVARGGRPLWRAASTCV